MVVTSVTNNKPRCQRSDLHLWAYVEVVNMVFFITVKPLFDIIQIYTNTWLALWQSLSPHTQSQGKNCRPRWATSLAAQLRRLEPVLQG